MNTKCWKEIPLREYSKAYKALTPLIKTVDTLDDIELSFPSGDPALKATRLTKYPVYFIHKDVDFPNH